MERDRDWDRETLGEREEVGREREGRKGERRKEREKE